MNFAGKMRKERLRQNISRVALAKATSLHVNTIDNIESNKTDASVKTAVKICKALGRNASDLIDT